MQHGMISAYAVATRFQLVVTRQCRFGAGWRPGALRYLLTLVRQYEYGVMALDIHACAEFHHILSVAKRISRTKPRDVQILNIRDAASRILEQAGDVRARTREMPRGDTALLDAVDIELCRAGDIVQTMGISSHEK
jgi:hypothetical protein